MKHAVRQYTAVSIARIRKGGPHRSPGALDFGPTRRVGDSVRAVLERGCAVHENRNASGFTARSDSRLPHHRGKPSGTDSRAARALRRYGNVSPADELP